MKQDGLCFLKPNRVQRLHSCYPILVPFHPLFKAKYTEGIWVIFNVENVDQEYFTLEAIDQLELLQDIRTEDLGEWHFVLKDPSNIAIDIVQHIGVE